MGESRGTELDDGMKDTIAAMMPLLDEYQRRMFLSLLTTNLGWGSASEISEFTGLSMTTLTKGKAEAKMLLRDPKARPKPKKDERIRAPGGGRKSKVSEDPRIREEILSILDGNIIGDPMSPITWTVKSSRTISDELKKRGFDVSHRIVREILKAEGFSLQQNKKYVQTGDPGPDRNLQFRFIKTECELMESISCPVISVDTKKKELVGLYKNNGKTYCLKGEPIEVLDHDFPGK